MYVGTKEMGAHIMASGKKNAQKTKRWTKRIVAIVLGIAVIGVAIMLFLPHFSSNISRAEMRFDSPIAAHFNDDVSAVISQNTPDINNNRDIQGPSDVTIWYRNTSGEYAPTFHEDVTDETLNKSVQIIPNIRGKWQTLSPDMIRFVPGEDWTPDVSYTIKLNRELFSDEVRVNTRDAKFKIAPITAKVDSFNIYPTSDASKSVVAVAVISFSNPIQTADFDDKLALFLNGKRIKFHVSFDRYLRTALIKTDAIAITDAPQTLRMKLNRVRASVGKSKTEKITADTTIAAMDNFFKTSDLTTIVADDKRGNPQQLILLNMTAQIKQPIAKQHIMKMHLLPKYKDTDEEQDNIPHRWANDEITPEIISKSPQVNLSAVDFANPSGVYQYAFGYDISDNCDRYIYVDVKPGIKSANGLVSKNGLSKVMQVPYPKRSVKIAGTGALLSLAGEKQIGIVARGGVDTAYVNLYKIETREINHLITQTYELFSNIEFKNPWNFDEYDMSVVFQKKIPFANSSMNRVNYAPLNLGEYMDRTYSDKTGIFIIKTGASQNESDFNDARLIIVTDLGIVRKVNLNKTSMVFVSHLSNGEPAADTDVTVLARNGRPIWAGVTKSDGSIEIPNFSWQEYKNEKEPVAIVARSESDVSFIPYYANGEQAAEFSKFDIGGTYYTNTTTMNAFVFSDRGIYRPGERVTIGTIIKNRDFASVAGLPIKMEISNPRGNVIFERKVSLADDGLFDTEYKLSPDSVIGTYEVAIYSLDKRGHAQETLGTANFNVQEFVSDTMKIYAKQPNISVNGWGTTNELATNVTLTNMYGTPASDRRISATATLRPSDFKFDAYSDYTFSANFASGHNMSKNFAKSIQTFTLQIPDVRTDENGNATLLINPDSEIPAGTYLLNMQINGFEAGDGKSVQTILNARVSNFEYLIGYKTNSDLNYLNQNAIASINLIALDNSGTQQDISNVKIRLIKRETLTSLIKDYNNNYKYQTVTRDNIVREYVTKISKSGTDIKLDTTDGGTHFLEIRDESDNVLSGLEYFVASNENSALQTDKNADLKIKLDASEYKPGAPININITSPYTGSGLITIERDKVYAFKWFYAKTTTSTQTITLPSDFEGTGYINVSFVRDINSPDIFTTPYTYAVAPFSTNIDKHKVDIDLKTSRIVTDNKLNIEYTTNKDANIMIFAVNTGILQVAKYKIPNPIAHFFQKAALQVETYQILSLLLPEYSILRQVAKTGGGDYSPDKGAFDVPLTNPFGHKNLPPVAFYSGIKKVAANTPEEIIFDIPEYFNGSISVYAVAASKDAMGAAKTETLVQSPIIISVSAPTFAAPGDKFKVNTVISNMTTDSGETATAQTSTMLSGNLIATSDTTNTMNLAQGKEKLWTLDLQTTEKLGNADIELTTELFDEKQKSVATRHTTSSLSIRPATVLQSEIISGHIKSSSTTIKAPNTDMYPEHLNQTLYIANNMSVLAYPMVRYLEQYDFSCTEQLVSKAFPYLLMDQDAIMGISTQKSRTEIANTVQILTGRQNDDGSFNLWAPDTKSEDNITNTNTAYITAYVMNFLSIAKKNGFNVPQSMYSRGMDFLRSYVGENTTADSDAFVRAFAIYVITANDFVTTSYIDLLQEYLNHNIKNWEQSIIGTYIAASYKMLKQNEKAQELINKYNGKTYKLTNFDNATANDAINIFIANKYFNADINTWTKNIEKYVNSGNYDSFNAAMIVMAASNKNIQPDVSNISVIVDGKQVVSDTQNVNITRIPYDAKKIQIECKNCKKSPLYYTIIRQGYPRTPHQHSNGLEITRHYYDINGTEITNANIGDIVTVKITARTRGDTSVASNVAISDLLPCGVMPVSDSLKGDMDFSEIREDRILIYTTLTRTPSTFTYRAQMTVAGEFTLPGISAQDMYNPNTNALGPSGTITVLNDAD